LVGEPLDKNALLGALEELKRRPGLVMIQILARHYIEYVNQDDIAISEQARRWVLEMNERKAK
jgi:hypothetical protein